MHLKEDNYLITDSNNIFDLTVFSTIGGRDNQQDCSGYILSENSGFVVLCDGMGGHDGGKLASNLAVASMLDKYISFDRSSDIHNFLVGSACDIDQKVSSITNSDGSQMNAGSTLVAVDICNNQIHWLSVGDSRIYIIRGGEMVQVSVDHTFELALNENKDAGLITNEFYKEAVNNSEMLISFLGVNGLPLIDCNEHPFTLIPGDKILLMSDGLYKNVSDESIKNTIDNFKNSSEALRALDRKIEMHASNENIARDNMTVALISIK